MGQQQCCEKATSKQPSINFNAQPTETSQGSPSIQQLQDQPLTHLGYFIETQPSIPPIVANLINTLNINKDTPQSYITDNAYQQQRYFYFKRTSIVYRGEWRKKKPHGKGISYYPNGGVYIGTFYEGIPYGYGVFVMPNGDYYQGQIKFGRANGGGVYRSEEEGMLYKGQFKDNIKHGMGQQIGNSYYFKGTFEYGQKKEGILKYKSDTYEGQFMNDKYQGNGKLTTDEGYYIGQFKGGLQHGYGQFHWNDKSVYRGLYKEGMRDGNGEFYDSKNCSISRGNWKNGYLQGNGQYVEPHGHVNRCLWNAGKIVAIIQGK